MITLQSQHFQFSLSIYTSWHSLINMATICVGGIWIPWSFDCGKEVCSSCIFVSQIVAGICFGMGKVLSAFIYYSLYNSSKTGSGLLSTDGFSTLLISVSFLCWSHTYQQKTQDCVILLMRFVGQNTAPKYLKISFYFRSNLNTWDSRPLVAFCATGCSCSFGYKSFFPWGPLVNCQILATCDVFCIACYFGHRTSA